MIKIPSKIKKNIASELKRYTPIVQNLKNKGNSTSEDDSRIVLNDILSDVLGYDKYNELRTEQREKAGRLDYVVKLTDGPFANKKDKIDFIVEAKAVHQELQNKYVDQTLTYCLTTNTAFFILTNVIHWKLYKIIPAKKNTKPEAELIHEVDFTHQNNLGNMAEEFYLFSRFSYLANDWKVIESIKKATNLNDLFTVLLSPKIIKNVSKILSEIHGVKISEEIVADIIENRMGEGEKLEVNRSLLRKLNSETEKRSPKRKSEEQKVAVRKSTEPNATTSEATNQSIDKEDTNSLTEETPSSTEPSKPSDI